MTDKNDQPELTPEDFIAGLDDEQLELVRLDYFNRLAAAASEAAKILGPIVTGECHQAIAAELLVTSRGLDFFLAHLDSFRAQMEKIDGYRAARRQ